MKFEGLDACRLCARRCGVNRNQGQRGYCRAGTKIRVARAALHHWEEPCISGEKGSGTVFFSYCSLGCVFCQNRQISNDHVGEDVEVGQLSRYFMNLQEAGAHNINLVTPTHYIPQIIAAIREARMQGLHLPIVYNTGNYETEEAMDMLNGHIDIYLPDVKYFADKYAVLYSHAPGYYETAKAALYRMVEQAGPPVFDEAGIMTRGVIVRHLMLPGLLFDSKKVLDDLHRTFGNWIYISLMNQYTPLGHVANFPELNRRLNPKHYDALVDYAIEIGIEQGFIQEGETAQDSFIPPFDMTGVGR